jgi:hypothetical protein
MNINLTLTNPGTLMSCAGDVTRGKRQGSGLPVSAQSIRGTHRTERFGATAGTNFAIAAVVGAYPQADVDLPTIKQFRVPLSLRERSS